MFERIFRNRGKEAEAKYEAELNKRLAERLRHYNVDEDNSVSNFSEIDFKENPDKASNMTDRGGNVDVWGQANPAETTQWNRENRRKSDRRKIARRKLDRH